MSKHTPGPWDYHVKSSGSFFLTFDPWKKVRVIVSTKPSSDVAYLPNSFPQEEVKANARLIAAAPDLLEELGKARAFIVHALGDLVNIPGHDPAEQGIVLSIDKAIAKATGGQP